MSEGPSTDVRSEPVIDPTTNVDALVASAERRLDDLRAAEALRVDQSIACIKDVAEIRAAHARELRLAEAARIDAIRAVDVGNVQRAAEVQAAQATTLASQVVASAEALRVALAAALEPIIKDIADLRRAQYEAQGSRTQVVETRASAGASAVWIGAAIAGVGLVLAVVALITTVAA